jgi:hypothetical protein
VSGWIDHSILNRGWQTQIKNIIRAVWRRAVDPSAERRSMPRIHGAFDIERRRQLVEEQAVPVPCRPDLACALPMSNHSLSVDLHPVVFGSFQGQPISLFVSVVRAPQCGRTRNQVL